MAKYKSIVVTNGGLDLVAAAHNGDTIEFTSIKTGAGVYDGTEVLAEATALKDVKQTLGISGLVKDDNVIKVNTTLRNDGLDAGYSLSELGLYAKDSSGNEILYAIVVAEPGREDYIPAYADAPTTVTFELYVDATAYESGVTFQATVIAGTYATPQDVSDAVASMTSRMGTMQSTIMQEVNAALAKKVNTADIVDNLTSTATDLPVSANQVRVLDESVKKRLMLSSYLVENGTPMTFGFRYGDIDRSSGLLFVSTEAGSDWSAIYYFTYSRRYNKHILKSIVSTFSESVAIINSNNTITITPPSGHSLLCSIIHFEGPPFYIN